MMIEMNQRNKEHIPKLVIPASIGLETDEEFRALFNFTDEWGLNYESIIKEHPSNYNRDEFIVTKEVLTKYNKRE